MVIFVSLNRSIRSIPKHFSCWSIKVWNDKKNPTLMLLPSIFTRIIAYVCRQYTFMSIPNSLQIFRLYWSASVSLASCFSFFFYGLSRGKKKLRTQKWSMIHSYQMLPAIICSFIDRKKSRGFDTSLQWPTFLTSYIHINAQSIYPIGQTWKVTLKISVIGNWNRK